MTAADTLTEAHRRAQVRVGIRTVQMVAAAWALVDAEDLDRSFPRWALVVEPLVQSQRAVSAALAQTYYQALRRVVGVTGPLTVVKAGTAETGRLVTSLFVTGPVSVRSAIGRGVPPGQAMTQGQAGTARSSMRHALNGGRETILGTAKGDPHAAGWRRVTSATACKFCLMLAGRGAVYRETTASFDAHDSCGCSAAPVFRT